MRSMVPALDTGEFPSAYIKYDPFFFDHKLHSAVRYLVPLLYTSNRKQFHEL